MFRPRAPFFPVAFGPRELVIPTGLAYNCDCCEGAGKAGTFVVLETRKGLACRV